MKDQLLEWKSKYGAVYQITLEGHPVYYRTLNGWEIQSVLELKKSNKAKIDIETATALMAVLAPTPLPEFKRPGTISSFAMEIWAKSFPTEDTLPTMAEDIRSWAGETIKENFSLALSSIMCKVMPSLDLAHLMDLPLSKLMKLGAIVEEITGTSLIIQDGDNVNRKSSPIREGYGISQEQADQTGAALSQALKQIKKKNR